MAQPEFSNYDIVVVDDSMETLVLLRMILEKKGYQVRTAMDGETALTVIQEKLPDLILLDIMLPGMDGYQICRLLKAGTNTRSIPILFISAQDSHSDILKAFELGGVDYLTKPVYAQEVLARVKTHLELYNAQKCLAKKNARLQRKIAKIKKLEAERRINEQLYRKLVDSRREADAALRASEARYHELFQRISSGVAIYEATGDGEDFIFKDINPAGETISKTVREDILGKAVRQVFPGVENFGLFPVLQEVWKTGMPQHHPASLYRDNRFSMWAENYVYKLSSGEIVAIYDDKTESQNVLNALRESEAKYRRLVDNLPKDYFFYRHGMDGIFTYLSPSITNMLGYSQEEFMRHYSEYLTDDPINEEVAWHTNLSLQGVQQDAYEVEIYHKNGEARRLEVVEMPVRGLDGRVIAVEGIGHDITERYLAEERLRTALAEKEVLLREVHHRVKNNMQIISSLLQMQLNRMDDTKCQEILAECQNRVQSMALVHEYLYKAADLSAVDFKQYVKALAGELCQFGLAGSTKVSLAIEMEEISLNIDAAVPCGLIVNELVSNALKHAFKNAQAGEIGIAMRQCDNQEIELIVSDNGLGMPPGINFNTTKSLGLYLVRMLVTKQLHGTVELTPGPRTEFHIRFHRK